MIEIEQRKSEKIKNKAALFVKFGYDLKKIEKIKRLPVRFYHPETREWEVPMAAIDSLTALFQGEEIKTTGTAPKVKAAAEIPIFEDTETEINFKTKPFKHQIEGVIYGLKKNKFLLADEQGLGKTKQAIDLAIHRKQQFKKALIICGVNGLKYNWAAEIAKHSDESGYILGTRGNKVGTMGDRLEDLKNIADRDEFFIITNIETLRDQKIQKEIEKLTKCGVIGMAIIDEIHKAANPTSKQGKAIHKIKTFYKMAATGTPLMNKPIDLYNILKWLDVEHHNFYSFKNRYAIMGGYGGYQIVGYKNLKELRENLAGVMLRRKKDDVLDLPPKIRITEYVEMGAKQSRIYKDVLKSIREEIDQIKLDPNPLSKLIRLRQATGYTGILSSTVKESAKIDRLKEIVEEAIESGEKIIIFSNWTKVLGPAIEALKSYNPAVITGQTKNNTEAKDRFQEDPETKIIMGTIGAMGTGLTLTAGSTVIFLDSPWTMANKEQAEDRAHRIGTCRPVNIITLVTKNTIDERIEEVIEDKKDMAELLVDGKIDQRSKSDLIDRLLK